MVLDEIQYAPDLLPYIKEQVDAHRDRPGQYLLTGSQNLPLMQHVTESLAGRAAVLKLLPMSRWEVDHHPQRILPWETGKETSLPVLPGPELWGGILRGFYPEIICLPVPKHVDVWREI